MGKLSRIIFVFAVMIGALIAGKNIVSKFVVENGIKAATGLPLQIKELNIGIISTHIGIKEFSLFNPSGFPREVMFYAPEIFVDYNLGALAKGKIHLEDMRFNFDQFVIVKNKDGRINLDALKPKEKKSDRQNVKKKPGKKKDLSIQIDHLMVKVGKVIYKDYSKGAELSIKEFNVNISQEYTDITNSNMNWLILLIAQKALLKTTLSSLADFNLDAISNAANVPKQTVDTLKNVPTQAADTLRGAADMFKNNIKLPFSSN